MVFEEKEEAMAVCDSTADHSQSPSNTSSSTSTSTHENNGTLSPPSCSSTDHPVEQTNNSVAPSAILNGPSKRKPPFLTLTLNDQHHNQKNLNGHPPKPGSPASLLLATASTTIPLSSGARDCDPISSNHHSLQHQHHELYSKMNGAPSIHPDCHPPTSLHLQYMEKLMEGVEEKCSNKPITSQAATDSINQTPCDVPSPSQPSIHAAPSPPVVSSATSDASPLESTLVIASSPSPSPSLSSSTTTSSSTCAISSVASMSCMLKSSNTVDTTNITPSSNVVETILSPSSLPPPPSYWNNPANSSSSSSEMCISRGIPIPSTADEGDHTIPPPPPPLLQPVVHPADAIDGSAHSVHMVPPIPDNLVEMQHVTVYTGTTSLAPSSSGEESCPSEEEASTSSSNKNNNNHNNNNKDPTQEEIQELISSGIQEIESVDRLEYHSQSDIMFHRQLAVRNLMETLHEVRFNESDLLRIGAVISRFAVDHDHSVRTELAEQLPQIACFCMNNTHNVPSSMVNMVFPIIEQFLTDTNYQVRKVTQNSLAFMLEQEIVTADFIDEKIFPVLVHLMGVTSEEYNAEGIVTISKIGRYLGKERLAKNFIHLFQRMCTDVSFHVRRSCANNFGEICTVVEQDLTETVLMPTFKLLCEDMIWGVRKACADVFVPISCVCSKETRKDILAPLFISLLKDNSKWVRTAAFNSLGAFISTFADPNQTGLFCTDNGIVVLDDSKDREEVVSGSSDLHVSPPDYNMALSEHDSVAVVATEPDPPAYEDSCPPNQSFSSFEFWKIPVAPLNRMDLEFIVGSNDSRDPTIKVSEPLITSNTNPSCLSSSSSPNGEPKVETTSTIPIESGTESSNGSNESSFNAQDANCNKMLYPGGRKVFQSWEDETNTYPVPLQKIRINLLADYNPTVEIQINNVEELMSHCEDEVQGFSSSNSNSLLGNPDEFTAESYEGQDRVPSDLLYHYLLMIRTYEDNEFPHLCAYSFPAVAMTLGRRYWVCLKKTYEMLAGYYKAKVRQTLANSMHQMMIILGPEIASRDLMPIFFYFLMDLDEVKFALLQNLASTVKYLGQKQRNELLPFLGESLKTDNTLNWRFRYTLSEQLIALAPLYPVGDIKKFLLPIGYTLLKDKVSEVRLGAIRLLSSLMSHFFCDTDIGHTVVLSCPSGLPDQQHQQQQQREGEESKKQEEESLNKEEGVEGEPTVSTPVAGNVQLNSTTEPLLVQGVDPTSPSTSFSSFCRTQGTLDQDLLDPISMELITEVTGLVSSKRWYFRQSFIFLSEQMIADQSLPRAIFAGHLFQKLMSLSQDPVANVRVALARCLARSVWRNPMFEPEQEEVESLLKVFSGDVDRDVKEFGSVINLSQELGHPNSSLFNQSDIDGSDMDMTLLDEDRVRDGSIFDGTNDSSIRTFPGILEQAESQSRRESGGKQDKDSGEGGGDGTLGEDFLG